MVTIVPVNDTRPHDEESTTCECNPAIKFENGEMILIHNSFDGREGVEWVNELLKNDQNTAK